MDVDENVDEPSTFAAKRTRTTRAGRADADAPEKDDPALGPDGKPYLVSGLYWSSALPPRTRDKPSSSAPTDWRKVTPTRTTALPPPVYHGETLVDDERAFRLPFDILRDCYFAPEAASRAGKGKGRKGKGKGRAGDEGDSATKREGKGGDKTTAADIAKRELSKKPEPYRHIGQSASSSSSSSPCRGPSADLFWPASQTSTSTASRTRPSCPPSACASFPSARPTWAAARAASTGASASSSSRAHGPSQVEKAPTRYLGKPTS